MAILGPMADRIARFVTDHDALVIVVMVLLTAAVGAGVTQLDIADQTGIDDEVFSKTEVGQALDYVDENYRDDEPETAVSAVYVRPADGNALSRSTLLATLEYQQAVLEEPTVADNLVAPTTADGDPIRGPPNIVGNHLAGPNASLAEQRAAIANASDAELEAAISESLSDPFVAGEYLPREYEPGATSAASMRVYFEFEQASVTQQQRPLPARSAQMTLYEAAADREAVFTMGPLAAAEWESQQIADVFWLIVPPALLLVLAVLAFAYRDLVDVLLGFVGVIVSLVWLFGILGWLGIPAGFASIVGPVLIVALSIDFGLHVFMRFREERGPEEAIRPALSRSTASVMVAFLLVALTAAVGFLANLTNPIGFIRSFGVVITLGVLASVLVFVTLVPALKVRTDSALTRFGLERRKSPLGSGDAVGRVLAAGVVLARRGPIAVVLLAVVLGGLGFVGYTDLSRQGFQEDFADEDNWRTSIPDPVGWSAHEADYRQNLDYVQAHYQSDDERRRTTSFLFRGDVTDPTALERIRVGTEVAQAREETFEQGGRVAVRSPLSLLERAIVEDPRGASVAAGLAESDDDFADLMNTLGEDDPAVQQALDSADPADVQDGDLSVLYDALYEYAPDVAPMILERTDGEYRSMRMLVPVDQGLDVDERGAAMHDVAAEIESDTSLDIVPVGFATVSNAGLGAIADSIVWTMLLAFAGLALVLGGLYRLERGSLTLGLVTVVPIVLVLGFVFGGMYVFDVPLTFVTAFLVSITIGLGIDYNIHVSDRFAHELQAGADPVGALSTTVRGTGGALLGSALTSTAAFATLLLHPSPVFQSFGFIVVSALLLSFLASVLVFPSVLLLWTRWAGRDALADIERSGGTDATVADD